LVLLQQIPGEWFTVVRQGVHEESSFVRQWRLAATPQPKKMLKGGLGMAKLASGRILASPQEISPGMPAVSVDST
jgi:hypothetical protein